MGQRNTPCTHQMLDLHMEEEENRTRHLHPDQCISGNIVNFTNQSIQPVMSASSNTAEHGMMFEDSHNRNTLIGTPYNSFQNFHVVPNLSLSASAPPPSFYNPCMIPSSSARNFTTNWTSGTPDHLSSAICQGVSMDNQFDDSMRGFGKRKNAEALPGLIQQNDTMSASSSSSPSFLSLNCGLPRWEPLYDQGSNLVDAAGFAQERGNLQTTQVAANRYVRSRSNAAGIQPESAYFPQYNYVVQGSHMGQSLHPANNVWMTQFAIGDNIGDMASSNWNYNHAITYLHGRWVGSGALEMTNMAAQAFPDASSTSSGFIFNPTAPLPNYHQHLSVMQPIQVENYGHNTQIQAPYNLPLNNLHPICVIPSSDALDPGSRFPHFPSSAQQIHRPRLLHRAAPDFNRSVRIISSEDAAVMGISGIYGVGVVDQHQDMRLDIDQMSYEELLALQEQIGDVKTGLTEEYILKNLKTSVHNPSKTSPSPLDKLHNTPQETEACIICQVEYEENEIIGTLNCGHNYHGECVKQWLLVKNLCPICKKTALGSDNNEG